MCVAVSLSSLNSHDVIPPVYVHFESNVLSYLSPAERLAATEMNQNRRVCRRCEHGQCYPHAIQVPTRGVPRNGTEPPRSKESDEEEVGTTVYASLFI